MSHIYKYPVQYLLLTLAGFILSCSADKLGTNSGEGMLLGSGAEPNKTCFPGSTEACQFEFFGEVDTELTTNCGTASAVTGSTSSSSNSSDSSSDSGDSSSDSDENAITAFYTFKWDLPDPFPKFNNATMLLKFVHNKNRDSFGLAPTSTAVQTCPTLDFINCNGTSGTNPECETIDNLTCGGNQAFIFTSALPAITFEAETGTINWKDGFTISSNNVTEAKLEFSMLSEDGTIFKGDINCEIE